MRGFSLSDWLPIIVHSRLDTLREFGADVEQWSVDEMKRFEANIVENSKTIKDDADREEYLEFHANTYHMYGTSYPQLSRELVWVKANFILESGLHEAVEWIETSKNPSPKYDAYKKNLKKAGVKLSEIGFAVSYIDEVAGILCPRPGLSAADPDGQNRVAIWNEIETIRVVRNAIVHKDGLVEGDTIPASSLAKLVPLDAANRVTFPGPVHDEVVKFVAQLFVYLENSLYPRASE